MIIGFKEGLLEVCQQKAEEGREYLTDYLNSEHIIFKRIALYALCKFGKFYPDLINYALSQRDYLENDEYALAYYILMRDQFNNASEDVRSQVITWILAGPINIDSRVNGYEKRDNQEGMDNDRQQVIEKWILLHLDCIRDFLKGESLSRLNELKTIYGSPIISEKPLLEKAAWEVALSPLSIEELSRKSFEEMKQIFLMYVPDDLFLNSRVSMAQLFQKLVSEEPVKFNSFAPLLIDSEIRFVYTYHFLSGIVEGIRNRIGRLNDEILSLCSYVILQKEDPFEESSGDYEPGLIAAQKEVASLLGEALKSDDPYLTREQLNRIRTMLINLAHHPDPKPGSDSRNNYDPFDLSMNCVRGVAMHGIIHYSFYLIRQQEKQKKY